VVEPALGVCSVESLTQLAFMVLATTDKPQVEPSLFSREPEEGLERALYEPYSVLMVLASTEKPQVSACY